MPFLFGMCPFEPHFISKPWRFHDDEIPPEMIVCCSEIDGEIDELLLDLKKFGQFVPPSLYIHTRPEQKSPNLSAIVIYKHSQKPKKRRKLFSVKGLSSLDCDEELSDE